MAEGGNGTQAPRPNGCLVILAIIGGLWLLGTVFGDPTPSVPSGTTSSAAPAALADSGASDTIADDLTGPQRNAVRTAQSYLEMSGFSRKGLIEQLSSEYGSGYERSDATVAVDSLGTDWNEQAVRSAKSYLEMTGFSCNGLIEQLSSDAGSGYTHEQATYGARQAGAC